MLDDFSDWKFGKESFESKENDALLKEIILMRDIKLAQKRSPAFFNSRERNLF
jgi:hypothetical protein